MCNIFLLGLLFCFVMVNVYRFFVVLKLLGKINVLKFLIWYFVIGLMLFLVIWVDLINMFWVLFLLIFEVKWFIMCSWGLFGVKYW